MEIKLIAYLGYIILSLILTYWVGQTLFKNGKIFLNDIFNQDETLTNSVNKLLLTGFYLINLGYILYNLISHRVIKNAVDIVELLSLKIGAIVIVLGLMHFLNLLILFRLRVKAKKTVETH